MSIVVLSLPDVKQKTVIRPKECPYCAGETFQRWGGVAKRVIDPHLGEVWVYRYRSVSVYRYRCCHCKRSFRHYPQGVDQADQTLRMRKLAAVLWVLGMSLRGVGIALSAFGVQLSHMSVWRDLQEQADVLEQRRRWQGVRVLGVDGLYPLGWDKRKHAVLVAVDLGNGQPVAVGYLDEANPQAVRRFLQPWCSAWG